MPRDGDVRRLAREDLHRLARVRAKVRVRVRIESVEVTVEMPRREAIREARVDLPQPEVPPG